MYTVSGRNWTLQEMFGCCPNKSPASLFPAYQSYEFSLLFQATAYEVEQLHHFVCFLLFDVTVGQVGRDGWLKFLMVSTCLSYSVSFWLNHCMNFAKPSPLVAENCQIYSLMGLLQLPSSMGEPDAGPLRNPHELSGLWLVKTYATINGSVF